MKIIKIICVFLALLSLFNKVLAEGPIAISPTTKQIQVRSNKGGGIAQYTYVLKGLNQNKIGLLSPIINNPSIHSIHLIQLPSSCQFN